MIRIDDGHADSGSEAIQRPARDPEPIDMQLVGMGVYDVYDHGRRIASGVIFGVARDIVRQARQKAREARQ